LVGRGSSLVGRGSREAERFNEAICIHSSEAHRYTGTNAEP
jgi:hypothetical protein